MSSQDNFYAQALGGQSVEAELRQVRGEIEGPLQGKLEKLQPKIAKAEALHPVAETVQEETGCEVEVEDILIMARTVLSEKCRALRCAKQTLEAFRLRHGLIREPQE